MKFSGLSSQIEGFGVWDQSWREGLPISDA
jgi:hypothetical protein